MGLVSLCQVRGRSRTPFRQAALGPAGNPGSTEGARPGLLRYRRSRRSPRRPSVSPPWGTSPGAPSDGSTRQMTRSSIERLLSSRGAPEVLSAHEERPAVCRCSRSAALRFGCFRGARRPAPPRRLSRNHRSASLVRRERQRDGRAVRRGLPPRGRRPGLHRQHEHEGRRLLVHSVEALPLRPGGLRRRPSARARRRAHVHLPAHHVGHPGSSQAAGLLGRVRDR